MQKENIIQGRDDAEGRDEAIIEGRDDAVGLYRREG